MEKIKKELTEQQITYPEKIARELFGTLEIVGCNPMNKTLIQRVLWWFHFACQLWWCGGVFCYNLCCYKDTPEFIEQIMYTAICIQVILKFAIGLIYGKTLSANLNTMFNTFWTDDDIVPEGRESYFKLNKDLHSVIKFYRKLFFYSIIVVAAETMHSTPFQPITRVWSPKSVDLNRDQPYAFLMYLGQIFSLAGCVILAIVPLDCIYILLVGSAYIQFDCIKSNVKHMNCKNKDDAYNTLIKCVTQHNLILVYLKKVESVYTLSLLSQLCATLFTICLAIYLSSLDTNSVVRPFLYAMLSSSQLLIYCLGGEMIREQGMSLADAAYESTWYDQPDKEFRGGLILMIQRSHRPLEISAGNVFILSMELFSKVLKASVSFMTMLKATTIKED